MPKKIRALRVVQIKQRVVMAKEVDGLIYTVVIVVTWDYQASRK